MLKGPKGLLAEGRKVALQNLTCQLIDLGGGSRIARSWKAQEVKLGVSGGKNVCSRCQKVPIILVNFYLLYSNG